jgi:hypothetical protein
MYDADTERYKRRSFFGYKVIIPIKENPMNHSSFAACRPPRRMKHLLAIMAFVAGGIGVEIAKPFNCLLITTSQACRARRTLRCDDGK